MGEQEFLSFISVDHCASGTLSSTVKRQVLKNHHSYKLWVLAQKRWWRWRYIHRVRGTYRAFAFKRPPSIMYTISATNLLVFFKACSEFITVFQNQNQGFFEIFKINRKYFHMLLRMYIFFFLKKRCHLQKFLIPQLHVYCLYVNKWMYYIQTSLFDTSDISMANENETDLKIAKWFDDFHGHSGNSWKFKDMHGLLVASWRHYLCILWVPITCRWNSY